MNDAASAAPSDAELFPLIEKHFGMVPRRDDTVIDRRNGRFHDAQRYRDFAADLLSARAQPTPPAVVEPLTDEQIEEVMDLVSDWGMQSHLRGEAELDAHNPEATEDEITYAKECAEKERAAWNAIKDKLKPHGIKGGQHGAE